MLSQKEFLVGCLIGGAIGVAAVAVSTQYSDELQELITRYGQKLNTRSLKRALAGVNKRRTPSRVLAAAKKKVPSKSHPAKKHKRTA